MSTSTCLHGYLRFGAPALLSAILSSACASVTILPLDPAPPPMTDPSRIAVLDDFPSTPYRAIARIQVRDWGIGRTEAFLRRQLLATAAELGAEAVVLERPSTRRTFGGYPGPFGLYDDLLVAGTAIVAEPQTCAWTPDPHCEGSSPDA